MYSKTKVLAECGGTQAGKSRIKKNGQPMSGKQLEDSLARRKHLLPAHIFRSHSFPSFSRAFCHVLLCAVGLMVSFSSSRVQGEEYSDFKNFLSASRPLVKLIRFSRSSSFYLLNGNSISNDVVYEASLQSDTYFIKESGYLWSPEKQDVSMAGTSHGDYWLINERNQVLVANRDPRIAGSNTPPQRLTEDKYNLTEDVLNFGIGFLDRSTMLWEGNEFTGRSKRADLGQISGRILAGDGTSPKSLEYNYSGRKGSLVVVNYYYETASNRPVWCPHLIVWTSPSFKNSKAITNSVETLALGKTDVKESGYMYADFYSGDLTMGNLILYSNGVGNLLVGTNFEAIANTEPTFKLKDRGQVRTLFFGFFVMITLVFGWYMARHRPNVPKTGE